MHSFSTSRRVSDFKLSIKFEDTKMVIRIRISTKETKEKGQ